MFANILNQIKTIIKQSQQELLSELRKEIRRSEALTRSDLVYLRQELLKAKLSDERVLPYPNYDQQHKC